MPGIPVPEIDPVAVRIGPLAIRWYALADSAGLLLGWWYMKRLGSRRGSRVSVERLGDFVVWATLPGRRRDEGATGMWADGTIRGTATTS